MTVQIHRVSKDSFEVTVQNNGGVKGSRNPRGV